MIVLQLALEQEAVVLYPVEAPDADAALPPCACCYILYCNIVQGNVPYCTVIQYDIS